MQVLNIKEFCEKRESKRESLNTNTENVMDRVR